MAQASEAGRDAADAEVDGRRGTLHRGRAATLGVLLSAVNPKNLLLTFAAATTIGATGIPGGDQALAFFVYVVIATMGVATPIVISLVMGERSSVVLADLKEWLVQHNAAIMTLLLLVIGAKVLGQGIG